MEETGILQTEVATNLLVGVTSDLQGEDYGVVWQVETLMGMVWQVEGGIGTKLSNCYFN